MAATAPPPPGAAAARLIHNRAPPPSASLLPFPGNINVNYCRSNNNNNNTWKKKNNNNIVKCKCYRRVQMDTPGAYQLVDDETGDKYIVWGGDDDDDVDVKNGTVSSSTSNTLPSKQLLSWKPPKTTPTTASASAATTTTNTKQESTQALAPGFGKLKAQRINNLVRRITQKKQQTNNLDYDDSNQERAPSPYKLEAELSDQSRPRREVMQRRKATADSESTLRDNASVSRPSHSSSRGWGDGRIRHYYASKTDDNSERWRQSNDKSNFFSRKTFQDLGCTEYVIESLRAQNYPRPSHIQAMAFGPVTGGKSCIIADQSGSGKTLSYLLPLVQRLREEELQGLGRSLPQSPKVVILVPTAELASQVLSVCRSLSKSGVPFRSMVTTGGFRQKTQLESLRQELDVLIATPGRFLYLVKEGFLQLTNLKSAVLDEVDILYNDEDFELALDCLVNTSPVTTQYIFVTATLPLIIYKKLVEAFPDSDVIMGPGVHRTSPGLEEILVDCSGDDSTEKTPETAFINKKNALQKLVEGSPVTRTIIFCHKIETCRKVENMLKRFDRKESTTRVLPFHAALDQRTRVANINEFRSSQSQNTSLFLVCTDRASRGIDFAGVDHVVLFDFPRDPSEYVRRVGRTARGAGGIGKAFIFVVGKQVSLAQRIIERNSKGHPLHDVPTEFD